MIMLYLQQYLPIVISSASVYLFIILAIRLFGKREFAQLSIIDLVFVLLISNAVQNAMVGTDTTLAGGLVAASTLFITNSILKTITYRFPFLQNFITGQPIVLVYKGEVNEPNLIKAHISINELIESIHEHGSSSIRNVDLAVLETDGNISVISDDFKKRSNKPRKRRKKLMA
ncbi:MAG: hypothetical protein K0R51_471 [Cytophagaceae bacterium]|jgi:uncharacterized membrane protein YcaP (DUF421 family)|nr:hypothetical protein [Cytophagaceae bacterium]